ncbi:DUF488 domain-containing protein [Sphingomonadaceae bacterium OTU29MARTA1]|uniref:DUF488 domain-containing protein n=1 Tax=Sphingomonas sp. Leaf37 TaxID=2876552 RepID=UPI001E651072|nr:DUF488 domain-containing protein [Sphingomonas sp. Leaf37]USU10130.1 DUF488 domain-containing protein [Sphingomonadaceae bacterium OTU29MARTA1]
MLYTIGYEGALLSDFLGTLKQVGVKQVIDIRDVPVSRRAGFSKNILARALEEEGLGYLHLRALGDPKPGREAAREGRFDAFREIYAAHISLDAGQDALKIAVASAQVVPSVLLCYERDEKHCHRAIVANAMMKLHSFQIRHLGVQKASNRMGRELAKDHGSVAIAPC